MAVTFFEIFPSLQVRMLLPNVPHKIFFDEVNDEVDEVDYRFEAARLESYRNWSVPYMQPAKLAAAGFYFTGQGDSVKCFDCHAQLYKWMEGDDPMIDHERVSPRCRFVCKIPCGNVPINFDVSTITSSISGNKCAYRSHNMERDCFTINIQMAKYRDFNCYKTRLDTFQNWPSFKIQTKEQLAEAGFFYTGRDDEVLCFHCGLGLKDWENHEIPWEMHAVWNPDCFYLLSIKGENYLSNFQKTLPKNNLQKLAETRQSEVAQAIEIEEEQKFHNSEYFQRIIESDIKTKCDNIKAETKQSEVAQAIEIEEEQKFHDSEYFQRIIQSDIEATTSSIAAMSVKETKDEELYDPAESLADQLLCQLCYINKRSVLFMPCQHIVACRVCTDKIDNRCPVCRAPIRNTLSILL